MENIIEFPDHRVIEEEASRWIVKFEGDEPPTKQDIKELNAWIKQSPAHRETLVQLASNWNNMDLLAGLAIPQERASGSKVMGVNKFFSWLFAPIMLSMAMISRLVRGMKASPLPFAAALGVLVLSTAFSSWLIVYQPKENIYLTSIGEQANHTLADGSVLTLNTDSRVEVVYSDNRRRLNLFKGEAHFDVRPDEHRPFEVYVGTRMVRAVGTAFSVYRDHDKVRVTVTEGKVDLAVIQQNTLARLSNEQPPASRNDVQISKQRSTTKMAQEGLVTEVLGSLGAGQSIEIPEDVNGLMNQVVNHEHDDLLRRLSWIEGQLVFSGEPLGEVVKEVSRYTSLTIEVVDPRLSNMRIGGQFQVGKTEALFDVLESSFGVIVSRVDEHHVQLRANEK